MHIHSTLAHSKTHTFLTLLLEKYIHQAKSPGWFFKKFQYKCTDRILFSE